MILHFDDYSEKWRVVSLALDEKTCLKLLDESLPFIYVKDESITLFPDNISLRLSNEEKEKLLQCHNFDVFQISEDGEAYLFFSNEKMDNAIITTSKCNSNCVMCPVSNSIRKQEHSVSSEKIIESIEHIPSDAVHLTITGGEPFLIGEKIFDIFQLLKKRCSKTNYLLLTNGRAFSNKKYIEKFHETSPVNMLVGIPLHGYNEETHDSITRSKGSFIQTYKGIKNLLQFDFQIELRIVVSKLNVDYIERICDLIIREFPSINSVKIIGLEMLGNAYRNREQVWISYSDAFKASKMGINTLIENGIDVAIYNFPLCSVDEEYHYICKKSITDYKIRFASECENCALKDACGGIFSGTIKFASNDVKAWSRND